ncbi:MAG TPA: SHOCT domain-containing protein [Pseudonocardia sp.]|jgi:hypothetical protein
MSAQVTPDAEHAMVDMARRYGLPYEAVVAMLVAVNNGGGTMAQFAIPELGGSGQWMRGGMTMVGDMFDNALKSRVDSLCSELAQLLFTTPVFPTPTADHSIPGSSATWWPSDLGVPSASGGQNDARYAIFPGTRLLAIQSNGVTRVFDTGEHAIGGVQQQQGGGSGSVTFTSQFGTFDVSKLHELGVEPVADAPPAPRHQHHLADPAPQFVPPAQVPDLEPGGSGDSATIIAAIESLAGLHQRGILTDEEFATKKAELLGRL